MGVYLLHILMPFFLVLSSPLRFLTQGCTYTGNVQWQTLKRIWMYNVCFIYSKIIPAFSIWYWNLHVNSHAQGLPAAHRHLRLAPPPQQKVKMLKNLQSIHLSICIYRNNYLQVLGFTECSREYVGTSKFTSGNGSGAQYLPASSCSLTWTGTLPGLRPFRAPPNPTLDTYPTSWSAICLFA